MAEEEMMTREEWKKQFMGKLKEEIEKLPHDLKCLACRNVLKDMDYDTTLVVEKLLVELREEGKYAHGVQIFYGWLGENV